MKGILSIAAGIFLAFTLGSPSALAAATLGKDYVAISPPQPTDSAGKIEVVEFFSYACPHCNHLEPSLEGWAKKVPPNVVLHRIPVTFGRTEWVALAKLYYTLDIMGQIDKLNGKVFQAIHEQHINLTTADACATWAATQGLDRQA